jgi:predicted nucleic acid-binding protein
VIVLDASAAVELLLETPCGSSLADRLARDDEPLHVPHLFDIEVLNAIRGLLLRETIDESSAEDALADLTDLAVHRWPHRPLLGRAWELRANVTLYDAVYLVLAEELGATLLTTDARLASIPGHQAAVEVV